MFSKTRTSDPGVLTHLGGRLAILLVAASSGVASLAVAQPGVADGRGMLIRNFEERAPAVGEPMPNLPVFDRDGQEFRFPALVDGRYTVLILGCLT